MVPSLHGLKGGHWRYAPSCTRGSAQVREFQDLSAQRGGASKGGVPPSNTTKGSVHQGGGPSGARYCPVLGNNGE